MTAAALDTLIFRYKKTRMMRVDIVIWWQLHPPNSWHTNQKVPLLPSGPGGVSNLSSQESEQSHHNGAGKENRTPLIGLEGRGNSQYTIPAKRSFCTNIKKLQNNLGGERGIRTPDRFNPIHAFQASSFSHSDTSPNQKMIIRD